MVTSVEEVRQAKDILYAVADRLRAEGANVPDKLPALGIMIEVPSAALEAAALAQNCDFMSIGTNDLIQYTLATDRTDERVAPLYNPLHPAVLKLLKMTIDGARAAGIPVSVCGEMASVPAYAPLLLGLGVRELSMPASNVPLVKERLRRYRMDEMEYFANTLLTYVDADAIRQAVSDFENKGK
jgi:phosphotransferase system enzyme I (PtsI)